MVVVSALHGRDLECTELGRLITSALDGAGGVVIVEGPAGIGKSRLLAQAAQLAIGQGGQVAAGGPTSWTRSPRGRRAASTGANLAGPGK